VFHIVLVVFKKFSLDIIKNISAVSNIVLKMQQAGIKL